MSEKLKISLDDPETRLTWEHIKKTAAQVAKWPCWKRGVQCPGEACPACKPCSHCEGRGYGADLSASTGKEGT